MASDILKHRTLGSALREELREAILSGKIAPGTVLRQDALAEEYGVSRIPVRDVLQHLEAEGFVTMQPRRGAVVTAITDEEIADVFALRAILEPRLLKASLPQMTPGDFEEVEQVQRAYVRAMEEEDRAQYGTLNAAFHMGLYKRAEMPHSKKVLAGLLQASDRYTRVQLFRPEDLFTARSEHAELLRLCRAGEDEAALRLLVRHIEGVQSEIGN